METAILNGAINMLHNLIILANHCLPLFMVSNASFMRRNGVVLCSVDGIRHSGRMVKPLYCPLELHILLPTGCICCDYGYGGSTL